MSDRLSDRASSKRQSAEGIRAAHGHGAPRSAILPVEWHGEAHVDLDTLVWRLLGEYCQLVARARGALRELALGARKWTNTGESEADARRFR